MLASASSTGRTVEARLPLKARATSCGASGAAELAALVAINPAKALRTVAVVLKHATFEDIIIMGVVNFAAITGTITATGDITAYSDASLKTEVATISNALGLVNSLRGVSFKRIDSGNRGIGVIAQELVAVVPEAVQANDDGLLSVAYGNLVGVLIEAVKELSRKIERLEAQT